MTVYSFVIASMPFLFAFAVPRPSQLAQFFSTSTECVLQFSRFCYLEHETSSPDFRNSWLSILFRWTLCSKRRCSALHASLGRRKPRSIRLAKESKRVFLQPACFLSCIWLRTYPIFPRANLITCPRVAVSQSFVMSELTLYMFLRNRTDLGSNRTSPANRQGLKAMAAFL